MVAVHIPQARTTRYLHDRRFVGVVGKRDGRPAIFRIVCAFCRKYEMYGLEGAQDDQAMPVLLPECGHAWYIATWFTDEADR